MSASGGIDHRIAAASFESRAATEPVEANQSPNVAAITARFMIDRCYFSFACTDTRKTTAELTGIYPITSIQILDATTIDHEHHETAHKAEGPFA